MKKSLAERYRRLYVARIGFDTVPTFGSIRNEMDAMFRGKSEIVTEPMNGVSPSVADSIVGSATAESPCPKSV